MSAITDPADPGSFLHPNRKRRGRAVALTLAVELALLLIVWFTPSFREIVQHPSRVIKTFDFEPPKAGGAPKAAASPKKQQQRQQAASTIPPPVIPPPITQPKPPPSTTWMSSSDFAGTDISKLGGGKGGTSGGKAAGYGPPDGKGSEFARADWYREPTRGELAAYLPSITEDSWAVIVCKTAEGNHVEDCYALAESPPGSGLAKALRRASWQFLVKAPRVDGKPQLGIWVRIVFDWKELRD